ncbi:hypothetical protein [Flavobacterium sp.]|jgi:hypothetical protein|uniref:hypothetical protein n=1 Tax=Flavobacterium sp. TaxID=239 RepID=UPI0037BFD942
MKKIVAIVFFMIAFGFSSNAQSPISNAKPTLREVNPKEAAYKDISDLSAVIDITPEFKNDLMTLFMMREEAIAGCTTEDERVITYQKYGEKIMSGLTEEQHKMLQQKPELYARLMKYKPVK